MNRLTLRLFACTAGVTAGALAALSLAFAMGVQFRVLGTAAFSLVFAAAALVALWRARRRTNARQGRFFHSLTELREDLVNLKP